MDKIVVGGTDNSGKPRQEYADRLAAMDLVAFGKEAG